jgi:hypothetical protein
MNFDRKWQKPPGLQGIPVLLALAVGSWVAVVLIALIVLSSVRLLLATPTDTQATRQDQGLMVGTSDYQPPVMSAGR